MTAAPLPARAGRSVVTAALVLFAVWTVVYHVALLTGLPSTPALAVAGALGVTALVLGRRLTPTPEPVVAPLPGATGSLAVLLTTVVATGLAVAGLRTAAMVVAVIAAAAVLAVVARSRWGARAASDPLVSGATEVEPAPAGDGAGTSPWLWPVAWVCAVLSAGLASVVVRPDGDDAYFVNLSTWVAERGRFPLRDTMISPDIFPALGAHSPPTHSVEGLIGAVARVVGTEAGTAAYVVTTPLVTMIAVLALALLVEEARIPTSPAGLVAAVTYLWTTGGSGYSLGSFFGVRMWQGKGMLVSLCLPLVLLTATRLVRQGSWRNHLLFGAALVAAVGASNTAAFIAPVLVAGVIVAALALRLPRAALRTAPWLAYPLAAGAVSVLLAPPAPTVAQRLAQGFTPSSGATPTVDPLLTVPGENGILVVTCLGIGLGALGIRNLVLRTATVGTLLVAGVTLLPGVRDLLADIGLSSVVWRLWWVVPVPLLLAGLVGAVTGRLADRPRAVVVAAAGGVAAVVGLVPLVGGAWVGDAANGGRLASPLSWKVPRYSLGKALFIESISRPGDTVLAPSNASRVLAALTVDVQPVAARTFYLPSYAATPGARAGDRERLQDFADGLTPGADTIAASLDLLSVDTACVANSGLPAIVTLRASGFREAGSRAGITCLTR